MLPSLRTTALRMWFVQPHLRALQKKERVRAALRLAQHNSLQVRRSNSLSSGGYLEVLGSDMHQGVGQWFWAKGRAVLRSTEAEEQYSSRDKSGAIFK